MTLDLISIRQFKCFSSVDIVLAPLTILSGFNAAGKSTTLQSLLLLAQGLRASPGSRFLPLNGPLVRLGTAGDVIRRGLQDPIEFEVIGFKNSLRWTLAPSSARDRTIEKLSREDGEGDDGRERLDIVSIALNGDLVGWDQRTRQGLRKASVGTLERTIRDLIFLGATRANQSNVYPSPEEAEPVHADVGSEGQFAPWWYVRTADDRVRQDRRHPDDLSVTIRAQTDAWLNYIFPGAAANAEAISNTGLSRLEFRMNRREGWSRPANIGYGLSYAFPLVVALLNSRPEQVIIVDSPEAHLHPRAQSRMGQMLAFFAAKGVQILVETHSDHVLSGARLSVRNGVIQPDQVSIHFFSGRSSEDDNGIISPTMDQGGYLSSWPEGFFDQIETDLAALAQPL